MSRKPDFESLEDWADRKLKQLGSPAAPEDFLSCVMQKVHEQPVAYVAPDNPSVLLIWIRYGVVLASACFFSLWMFADVAWVEQWWYQSWLGSSFSIGMQLWGGVRQIAESLIGLVPQFVWIGLGISVITAYVMVALTGAILLHFTFNRTRVSTV